MTTGNEIHDSLGFPAGVATLANSLLAINDAIRASWPALKVTEYAAGGTLAAATFDYSLAATDLPEWGVSQVFVDPLTADEEPEILVRAVRQYHDGGTWHLVFDPDWVETYAGYAFHVAYQRAHAVITTLDDTVTCPAAFVLPYVRWWYGVNALYGTHLSREGYRDSIGVWKEEADRARKRNLVLPLVLPFRAGKDRVS